MGSAHAKDPLQPIAYQRDLLGACWDSPYGEREHTHYLPSRWMGISQATMELYTGSSCFGVRSSLEDLGGLGVGVELGGGTGTGGGTTTVAFPTASVSGSPRVTSVGPGFCGPVRAPYASRPLPNQSFHQDSSVEWNEISTSVCSPSGIMGGGSFAPRSRPLDREKTMPSNTGVPQPRFVTQRIAEAFREAMWWRRQGESLLRGPRAPMGWDGHPFLRVHRLSVHAGVLFRVAPAHRRYEQIRVVKPPRAILTKVRFLSHSTAHYNTETEEENKEEEEESNESESEVSEEEDEETKEKGEEERNACAAPLPVIVGTITAVELLELPPTAELCFGRWLYVSLQDEQARLRRDLARVLEEEKEEKQTTARPAPTIQGAAAPSHVDPRDISVEPSWKPISPLHIAPKWMDENKTGQDTDKPPHQSAQAGKKIANEERAKINQTDKEAALNREVWIAHAYLLVALPMYECRVVPNAHFLTSHAAKPVALNLADTNSRRGFGVGCLTALRYGGLMVLESRACYRWDRPNEVEALRLFARYAAATATRTNKHVQKMYTPIPSANSTSTTYQAVTREAVEAGNAIVVRPWARQLASLAHRLRARLRYAGFTVIAAATYPPRRAKKQQDAIAPTLGATTASTTTALPSHAFAFPYPQLQSRSRSRRSSRLRPRSERAPSSSSSSHLSSSSSQVSSFGAARRGVSFGRTRALPWGLRGTFRQLGGRRFLDAGALLTGCRLTELLQSLERWVRSLTQAPVRARPLGVFLQRYEGLAHSLRQAGLGSAGTVTATSPLTARASGGRHAGLYPLANSSFCLNGSFGARPGGAGVLINSGSPRNLFGWNTPAAVAPPYGSAHTGGSGASGNAGVSNSAGAGTGTFPWALKEAPQTGGEAQGTSLGYFLHRTAVAGVAAAGLRLYSPYTGPLVLGVAPVRPEIRQVVPVVEGVGNGAGTISSSLREPGARKGKPTPILVGTRAGPLQSSSLDPSPASAGVNGSRRPPSYRATSTSDSAAPPSQELLDLAFPAQLPMSLSPAADSNMPFDEIQMKPHGGASSEVDAVAWARADRTLRSLRADLEEMQLLVSYASSELQERLREYLTLGSLFLPHTRPDQLEPSVLFLRTLQLLPGEVPSPELHTDWLPSLLALLLTAPETGAAPVSGAHQEKQEGKRREEWGEKNFCACTSYTRQEVHGEVCDLNQRSEAGEEDMHATPYTVVCFPVAMGGRRGRAKRGVLQRIILAPLPYRLTPSMARLLERAGVDSGLSFCFTGGSLGVLAGVLQLYTDRLADALQRLTSEEKEKPDNHSEDTEGNQHHPSNNKHMSPLERLVQQGWIILRRIALWGAVEGKGRLYSLEKVQKLHAAYLDTEGLTSNNTNNGEGGYPVGTTPVASDNDTDSTYGPKPPANPAELHAMMVQLEAHAVHLGWAFRSAECFALFDAVARYLEVLDRASGPNDKERNVKGEGFEIELLADYYEKARGPQTCHRPPPPTSASASGKWATAKSSPKQVSQTKQNCIKKKKHFSHPHSNRTSQKSRAWQVDISCCGGATAAAKTRKKGEELNTRRRRRPSLRPSSPTPSSASSLLEETVPQGWGRPIRHPQTALFAQTAVAGRVSRVSRQLVGSRALYCGGEGPRAATTTATRRLWKREAVRLFEFLAACLGRWHLRRVFQSSGAPTVRRRLRITLIHQERV